jgi:hypothetical protein
MHNYEEKKPLLPQGWLRVILFIPFFLMFTLIIFFLFSLLISTGQPVEFTADYFQESFKALGSPNYLWLLSIGELVSVLGAVIVFRKFVDRRNLISLGLLLDGQGNSILAGLFLAPALIGLVNLGLYLSGHLEWDGVDWNIQGLIMEAGSLILIALAEEILIRGYILNNLLNSFNRWVALVISALVFALLHFNNPDQGTLPFLSLLIAGILLGLGYTYTKNLWFAIALHFSWNFFEGPIAGFRISGQEIPSLLLIHTSGDASITGGGFGLEGSILTMALLFIAVCTLMLFYEKRYAAKATTLNDSSPS